MPASDAIPSTPPAAAESPTTRPVVLPPSISIPKRGPWFQFHTAKGFETTHARFPVQNLPPELNGFRILHLSDIHSHGGWDPAFDDLIAQTADNPPDMILFTGDFVDNRYDHRPGFAAVQKLMDGLQSRLGAFAILGNHDGDLLGPALAQLKITLIDHRQLCLHSGSATLELIGLTGVERKDLDLTFLRSITPRPDKSIRIVLAHYPDIIRKAAFLAPDLYLCGHTHGGQICLPGRIPLIRHDSLPRRLCSGIHKAFGAWLITNRGLGFSSRIRARLFCPTEVIEIQLAHA